MFRSLIVSTAFMKDHSHSLPLALVAKTSTPGALLAFLEAGGVSGAALEQSVRSWHPGCSAAAASVDLFPLPEFIHGLIQLIVTQLRLC